MVHDLGWKGDSSGHPTYGGGCPDSRGEKIWGRGGQSSRGKFWIDREESRRLSVESSAYEGIEAGLEGHLQNSKQARLAGTESRPNSSVRSEAGEVGKVWSWSGLNSLKPKTHRVVEILLGTRLWEGVPFFS